MPRTYDQKSSVARTLDVLGDRWTLLIIRDLLLGKSRFREFVESLKGIPTNVLSERFKFLEANGIVNRTIYNEHPPRAEYSLTPKGQDLHWVIDALAFWGSKYTTDDPFAGHTHTNCGHPVILAWHCVDCGEMVEPSAVNLDSDADPEEG